jgi:hypothetical protein
LQYLIDFKIIIAKTVLMDEILFKKSFEDFGNIYRKILLNIYPANESKGFEERNLTHNYVHALIRILDDEIAIAWFEMSLEGRGKIDAVVFSPKYESVFFIEAKRLVNRKLNSKIDSINKDFDRLFDKKNRDFVILKWKSKTAFHYKYIVCLADVWTEQKDTLLIPDKWNKNEIITKRPNSKIIFCDHISYRKFPDLFHKKESLDEFNLLISVSEIINE